MQLIVKAQTASVAARVKAAINAEAPTYDGAYEVDPDFDGTILLTAGKRMAEDVTVHPIEVQRVSNPQGGRTVYIGGIIDG